MRSLIAYSSFKLMLLAAPATMHAQWVQTQGPYGGFVQSVCCDRTGVYAAITRAWHFNGGVYRSTNAGTMWSRSDMGLPFNEFHHYKLLIVLFPDVEFGADVGMVQR
jgi:hypothetical protein